VKKGELNRRIEFWRSQPVNDGLATVPGVPVSIGKRWAKKVDVSDGERMRAGQQGQSLDTRFVVLSDALTRTITGKDKITWGDAAYEVVGTKEIGSRRNDAIEITTTSQPDMRP
jgi:head-tail adaptor